MYALYWWCREKDMFDAYFLLFLKKLKVIVSSLWREVTKVLHVALWLCEKPLVYFSSLLEKNELKNMAFEDI